MRTYVLRRLLQTLPLLVGISLLTFLLLQLAPGDFLSQMGENPGVSAETLSAMRRNFGLDRPWYVQYAMYLRNIVLRFDFGESFSRHQPVFEVLREGLLNTLLLAIASALVTWGLAIPLGIWAAVRQHSWADRLLSLVAFIWLSVPEILSGLLMLMFAARTGWFPVGGMRSLDYDDLSALGRVLDVAHHLVLPAGTLAIIYLALYSRLARASMIEVLGSDYVRTARAKGLSENKGVFKHALRNAILPVVTIAGLQFSGILAGAVLVETVFTWPGMGLLAFEAILRRDTQLILGILLLSALLVIVGNLSTDLAYRLIDPRIRTDG